MEAIMSEHRAYQLYAHLVWHTWRRVGCINEAAVADVGAAVQIACSRTGVKVIVSAVLTEHVHFLVSFRPQDRLSDFVRVVKCGSGVAANRRVFGSLRWCRGFSAATVSRQDLPRLKRYIAGQFRPHPDRIPQRTRLNPADPG